MTGTWSASFVPRNLRSLSLKKEKEKTLDSIFLSLLTMIHWVLQRAPYSSLFRYCKGVWAKWRTLFFFVICHLNFVLWKQEVIEVFFVIFQEKLGEIVYVELPEVNAEFEKEGRYNVFWCNVVGSLIYYFLWLASSVGRHHFYNVYCPRLGVIWWCYTSHDVTLETASRRCLLYMFA